MFTRFKKASFVLSIGSLLGLTGILPSGMAAPGQGVPFQELQAQIDALRETVEQLSQQMGGGDKVELVECDNGATIADALAGTSSARRVTLTITGQCNEAVNLTRDDVTLLGGSGTITGRITLDGAHRIVIDGLTLPGGIAATRGATVLIQNSMIDVGSNTAILVNHGSFAEIFNNPLIQSQEGCAVQVSDSGEVRMQGNSMIQSNQSDTSICSTLGLFRQGLARLRGGNNFVNNVGGDVFEVIDGSVLRQDGGFDSFQGNGAIARMGHGEIRNASFNSGRLQVGNNSSVRFQNSVLNGALAVFNMSFVELRTNTTLNESIGVFQNSTVRVRPGNSVNGDMVIGARSQAIFDFGGAGGTVNGHIICDIATSPRLGPPLGLQLLDPPPGFGAPITTTGGDPAFAYRGAVVGSPLGTVSFENCN